jgi:hypothetical protein
MLDVYVVVLLGGIVQIRPHRQRGAEPGLLAFARWSCSRCWPRAASIRA